MRLIASLCNAAACAVMSCPRFQSVSLGQRQSVKTVRVPTLQETSSSWKVPYYPMKPESVALVPNVVVVDLVIYPACARFTVPQVVLQDDFLRCVLTHKAGLLKHPRASARRKLCFSSMSLKQSTWEILGGYLGIVPKPLEKLS